MYQNHNINYILDDIIHGVINVSSSSFINAYWPEIGEEVMLQPSEWDHQMSVKIHWMSEDKEIFRGEVINGYYPRNKEEKNFIKEGEMVEFSRKKIISINHD